MKHRSSPILVAVRGGNIYRVGDYIRPEIAWHAYGPDRAVWPIRLGQLLWNLLRALWAKRLQIWET